MLIEARPMYQNLSNQELLERFYRMDDDSAFERFIQRNRQWAIQQARQFYLEEAEDIVQVSILKLMDTVPVNGSVRNPLGWWRTIIGATAVDHLRSAMSRRERELRSCEIRGLSDHGSSLVEEINRGHLIELIHKEIEQLDDRFKEPLLKRYFEDMSYSEISNLLRISPGTVASRLARGIAHIRDRLTDRGVYEAAELDRTISDKHNSEGLEMTADDREKLESNQEFANKWKDVWMIAGSTGLGHIHASESNDGAVTVSWRLEFPVGLTHELDHPESAADRLWFENEIVLTDVNKFVWTEYRTREGATGAAIEAMRKRGMTYDGDQLISFADEDKLTVQTNGSEDMVLTAPSNDPVIPDLLLPLFVSERELDAKLEWPIGLLGFDRDQSGRQWGLVHTRGRYTGRKGIPTGLSHTFEVEMRPFTGRDISIWLDDDRRLIGFGDERESFIVTEDEATARAMLTAGSS